MKSFFLSLSLIIIVLFSFIFVSVTDSKVGFPVAPQCNGTVQQSADSFCQQTVQTGETSPITLNLSPSYTGNYYSAISISVQAESPQCANSIANVITSPTQLKGINQGLTYYISDTNASTQVSTITLVAASGGFQCPNGIWVSYTPSSD